MDTIDRSSSNTPARLPGEPTRLPAPVVPAFSRDLATAQMPQISPQVIARGLARHWWRIALITIVISAPIAYWISLMIKPTYEAFSLLEVVPTHPQLFNAQLRSPDEVQIQPFIESQISFITSNNVLDLVVGRPHIAKLAMIAGSNEPTNALRSKLAVQILSSYVIRVALASEDPQEAADLVNAVVQAYITQHRERQQLSNKTLKEALQRYITTFGAKIDEKSKQLKELVARGNVQMQKPSFRKPSAQEGDGGPDTSFSSITEMQYFQLADSLMRTELELIEAKAEARAMSDQAQERARQLDQQDDDRLIAHMKEQFLRDPDVAALAERIELAEDRLNHAKGLVRQDSDPSVVHAAKEYRKLMGKYNRLWEEKYDEMSKQLRGEKGPSPALAELQNRIFKLEVKRMTTADHLERFRVQTNEQNNDTVAAQLLNMEIHSLMANREGLERKIHEIEFQTNQETYRVSLIDLAAVPKTPLGNKKMKYMASAPVGVLCLMLLLFLILEVRAERVADPDTLSIRVQSEVYALPPLPTNRELVKLKERSKQAEGKEKARPAGVDDQIGRFIQRLDHLRFAVCGNAAELDKGRCMLITSAVAGEGKTTLAAQLAARCGHAGMSTLLIDADLRRGSLCTLLAVPEGPGLSDALEIEGVDPREFVRPVQGGAFHLLPSGALLQDTGRVIQDRKFGLLLAQFRQDYDLIIIDAPPVLPVPDPLIMGRWCDGVVLAVRYDISRFPQVERARRQLDNAGIPVLGTVINGMRNSDSYYGHYSYDGKRSSSYAGRSSSPQPDPSNAL